MKLLSIARFLLPACLFCLSFTSFAQTEVKIRGKVTDENDKPLTSVTVSLLKAADSSLIKVALTDASGVYEFTGSKDGQYLTSVSSIGFSTLY
ncbi:MAG TPA: carboxypeptidase-like regulatory domain-containing protein, partial [Flavisolibacter sp.]|nr:carboxypeptidase-like regulatory domain-containing protein [Flavisolibacter sp.]